MSFRIGQKVVRVAGTRIIPHNIPLTVSIVVTCPRCGIAGLGVEEYPKRNSDPEHYCNCDCGFDFDSGYWLSYSDYFRPLEDNWAEEVLTNSLPKQHPVFSKIKERVEK